MNVRVFQHVEFEGAGFIELWATSKGFNFQTTRLYAGDPIPKTEEVDFLVIMGGTMSVNDEVEHGWLKPEKEFVRNYIEAGKPAIGVCLGAQLIASCLGQKVYAGPAREIGWFKIQKQTANTIFESVENDQVVLHWHGETFDLPAGAELLASSEVCTNQAFLLNRNVLGVQFHFEMTEQSLHSIVENCGHEIDGTKWTQSVEEIKSRNDLLQLNQNSLEPILEKLIS